MVGHTLTRTLTLTLILTLTVTLTLTLNAPRLQRGEGHVVAGHVVARPNPNLNPNPNPSADPSADPSANPNQVGSLGGVYGGTRVPPTPSRRVCWGEQGLLRVTPRLVGVP